MFDKILVANRGEIAVRIFKTARKMGIRTVAVYSEADTNALHVQEADEAVYIGPSPSVQSYLKIPNLIKAIHQTGAQAVHPGYGFLSENDDFVKAVERARATFIGPGIKAVRVMGDKIESKKLAEKAGVSTVPGVTEAISGGSKEALKIANDIGYPVMIKAAAGGGGKGMRVARDDQELKDGLRAAANEAGSSFNDDRVFIEKFIEKPRHIEIQILADKHGNCVYLGERECSIQRRHQKVIEEAPSAFLDDETRKKMGEQAVALAKEVGYVSAGTVEFIVDQGRNFYFLEMNTRLQVEHRVTELITGIDLVEQMIRIAAKEKLPFTQDDIVYKGWAIESRVYAEDPTRGFLPSAGRITRYLEPEAGKGKLLIDSGVYEGGEVSMFYDPMIAKVCTHASNRDEAIEAMNQALGAYVIRGISHNISFLQAVLGHERFIEGDISTNFIAEEYPEGFEGAELTQETAEVLIATAVHIFLRDAERAAQISGQLPDRERAIGARWVVSLGELNFSVYVRSREYGYDISYDHGIVAVRSSWTLGRRLFQGTVNNHQVNVQIRYMLDGYVLTYAGTNVHARVYTPRVAELARYMPHKDHSESLQFLRAPIAGMVTGVLVEEGQTVKTGQELLLLEAMKMENTIRADHDATVKKIEVDKGNSVAVDDVMIEFEE